MRFILLVCLSLFISSACASMTNRFKNSESDPYVWLEEIEGERALAFAREQSDITLQRLKADPRFAKIEKEISDVLLAKDRLPYVSLRGGFLYNFWQDDKHVRGVWRRTTFESYASRSPQWEVLIDVDALAKAENENWVWSSANCLPPKYERCLIHLSRGGKDAKVVREFDLKTKKFVDNGFNLPEAKSRIYWADENTVFVATDFGPGTLTDSGYPMIVKLWRRGQKLEDATEVLRGEKSDISVVAYASHRPEGTTRLAMRALSFYESKYWLIDAENRLVPIPMPSDAALETVFKEKLLFSLRSDLKTTRAAFKAGSIVALPIAAIKEGQAALEKLEPVFTPTQTRFLEDVSTTRDFVLLDVLDNVNGKILRYSENGDAWVEETIDFGSVGNAYVNSSDSYQNRFIASYQDFVTPTTLLSIEFDRSGKIAKKVLKSSPPRFNAKDIVAEQRFAVSRDGTMIPYFIVHKRNLVYDGKNPTLLYGYGGFQNALTPFYLGSIGKVWLERGGVYVLANIRGGGEFGPDWHRAALRENRQRAFDDFAAIAEDLIQNKITSPRHLGIQGGSNGGLLTSVAFTQRPDLFNAVVSSVPLTDMLRHHKLLAGASWMEEYGNPDDPKMREVLLKYSPYHNLRADTRYPEVLFTTSTKDDRVHPAHARKMVAKMKQLGHPVLYYENIDGGHAGAANLKDRVLVMALEFTYLWHKLGP